MGLISSLFSGVSGLRNHQTLMDVIGNNIANVNTVGFKGSRVTFADTFHQYARYGSEPTKVRGGQNAFQIGLGMQLNSIDRDWGQGSFESTGITTDMALQGEGMFIIKRGEETLYTRAGSFTFDADGYLVNPNNGYIVQGKNATSEGTIPPGNRTEDIYVDPNLRIPAQATTDTTWGGNLSNESTLTRSENYEQNGNLSTSLAVGDTVDDSNTIYDEYGNEYTFSTTWEKTGANAYNLSYELTDSSGAVITSGGPTAATFDAATGDMLTLGGAAPAAIDIIDVANNIDFDYDPSAITNTAAATSISSSVDGGRDATLVSGALTIYDSLGSTHSLTLQFTKISDNNWRWQASTPSSSGTLSNNEGTISFNADGSVNSVSPNPPVLTFTPDGGAESQNITLDFGEGFNGITQTSTDSVLSNLTQNGSATAYLEDISIDQYGIMTGVFTNGTSQDLAQVMVATFPNRNGMVNVGDNLYAEAPNSGTPYYDEPGDTTKTYVYSGNLEQSNVDLSEEFTRMIIAQRGFQSNARVITVSDQIIQEITNLIR